MKKKKIKEKHGKTKVKIQINKRTGGLPSSDYTMARVRNIFVHLLTGFYECIQTFPKPSSDWSANIHLSLRKSKNFKEFFFHNHF